MVDYFFKGNLIFFYLSQEGLEASLKKWWGLEGWVLYGSLLVRKRVRQPKSKGGSNICQIEVTVCKMRMLPH